MRASLVLPLFLVYFVPLAVPPAVPSYIAHTIRLFPLTFKDPLMKELVLEVFVVRRVFFFSSPTRLPPLPFDTLRAD
jgi:hypothetical protein